MKKIRYLMAVRMFDLAARLYPGKGVGQAHHVGDKWLDWRIGK